jgi:ABC-2 type transport system permease protein
MSKLGQIVLREYTTRVRKKSFIIMSIIGPLLFAGLMIVPIWISMLEDKDVKNIAVIELDNYDKPVPDSLMLFRHVFENKPLLKFDCLGGLTKKQAEALAGTGAYYGALVIRYSVIFSGDKVSVEFIGQKQPSMGVEAQIERTLETYLYNRKLLTYHVPPSVLNSLKSDVTLVIQKIDKEGNLNEGNVNAERGVGYVSGFLIYFFIFMFGAQVMRGVVEEKTNRIVEVIITSVKPFQLMMGKIVGIGLVGMTQFLAWIILSFMIFQFAEGYMLRDKLEQLKTEQQSEATDLFQAQTNTTVMQQSSMDDVELSGVMKEIHAIDFKVVLLAFVFYFLGGYLLYGSMFAAIGAAVDSETDTQQFMLPVTIPLVIAIIVMMNAITNPEGQVAMWFSIIPFTSPVVMMARIGFDIPIEQLIISVVLLIATFVFMTWLSSRIYRKGILMYGKKFGYKDLFRWIRMK